MNENIIQDSFENMSPEEAIKQMMAESEPVYDQSQMESLKAMKEELSTPSVNSTRSPMNFEEYSRKSLKVFQTISDMMGDFFNSIKTLNASFSTYADAFYSNARNIGATLEKRKLTEQEFNEMVGNILVGTVINGVGELWASIKKQSQLNDVKQLLRQDALANEEVKRKAIKEIKKNIQDDVDAACEQYDLCVEGNNTIEDLHEKFEAMRLALYNQRLVLFLDATYEAAIEGKFQNDYPYPNLFDLNLMLFEFIFDLKEKHSSDEAKMKYYRNEVEKAINGIASAIKGESTPSVGEVLLAMDSGLMGVAIYVSNPVETIGYDDEGELMGVDDNNLAPYCRDFLSKFVDLFDESRKYESTSTLANYLINNTAFIEGIDHISELYLVPQSYQKRMLVMNINIILTGILAFVVSMDNGLKWYWSLVLGIVGLVLMAIISPAKSTTLKFMKKLNYVERAIKVTALKNAGFQEGIDLHAIQTNNNSIWMFSIICALVGSFAFPIGTIIGFLVGPGIYKLLKFLSSEDEDDKDYDYASVSTGKSWKGYFVTAILVIGIIMSLIGWLLDSPKVIHSSSHTTDGHIEDTAVAFDEVAMTQNEVEEMAEISDEDAAIKNLFRIFYFKEEPPYATCSKALKNKFEELGITYSINNPYTPSFKAEIDRMENLQQEVGDLSFGFDSDILFLGQGDVVDMNMEVLEVKKISDDAVSIRARYHNGEDCDRTFKMKKVDGVFKIDDMDGMRAYIKEECANAQQFLKESGRESSSVTQQINLSGKMGDYPIVVKLDINNNVIEGKYAYESTLRKYGDKPASYFYLSGKIDESGNMNMESRMHNSADIFEYIALPSPELKKGSIVHGKLINANTGHEYPLELIIK